MNPDDQSDYSRILELRADYEHQQDNERRMVEEEHRRYLEAHPLADKCRNHQERDAINPLAYDKQFCAECISQRRANYADGKIGQQRDSGSDYSIIGGNLHYCGQYVGPMTKETK